MSRFLSDFKTIAIFSFENGFLLFIHPHQTDKATESSKKSTCDFHNKTD